MDVQTDLNPCCMNMPSWIPSHLVLEIPGFSYFLYFSFMQSASGHLVLMMPTKNDSKSLGNLNKISNAIAQMYRLVYCYVVCYLKRSFKVSKKMMNITDDKNQK